MIPSSYKQRRIIKIGNNPRVEFYAIAKNTLAILGYCC